MKRFYLDLSVWVFAEDENAAIAIGEKICSEITDSEIITTASVSSVEADEDEEAAV